MDKTMYEINYHSVNGTFSHCTVTPVTVIRVGMLPGCSGISITATDCRGNKFQGSPEDYYLTEEDAWDAIKREVYENVLSLESHIEDMQKELTVQRDYLEKLYIKKEAVK